jgi:hypothetical protein
MPTATNRSWVGLSSLSANGYPNGGPWRQFHCIACGGYAFETYGTILHGKRVPADRVAAVGRRVDTVCKHEVDLRQQLVVFHMYHTDIPHGLVHFHEYSAIKSYIRCAEELKQALMLLGEVHYHGVPLPRDAEHMNPDKVMEHPACCGVLHRFALLVGKCRVVVLKDLTDAVR